MLWSSVLINTFYKASMGPPIYIGGNYQLIQRRKKRTKASMGPPIYIGGN